MNHYVIVTESGADLPPDIIEHYQIRVLPMHVELDSVDYLDDGSLTVADLCQYYINTKKVPKTAAVSPDQYQTAFNGIFAEDPEAVILHLSYGAKLTCTYQNAVIASDGNPAIHHLDTANVSGGFGFIVRQTAELIRQQPEIEIDELIRRIHLCINAAKFSFVPGNLDYLRAGGRVSNAQFLGATLLRIKPLIELINGDMLSVRKFRGNHSKVVTQMITDFFEKSNIDKKEILLLHAHELDASIRHDVDGLLQRLEVKNYRWIPTGCVITSHSGPGGIGIAGIRQGVLEEMFAPGAGR